MLSPVSSSRYSNDSWCSHRVSRPPDAMYLVRVLLFLYLRLTVNSADNDRRFHNVMERIPIFSMPYIANIPIPMSVFPVKPTPVVTTKVLNVVTRYVLQNPVCIKVSGKKPMCKRKPQSKFTGLEYTVNSAGYSVEGRESAYPENTLESSIEEGRVYVSTRPTPTLSQSQIELLIEDRLDHLEEILPHYKRRRVFATKVMTVTKTVQDRNRDMATLTVKNCIPVDMQRCPKKVKNKKRTRDFVGTPVVRA